jgi:outer membrane immunogenic protein
MKKVLLMTVAISVLAVPAMAADLAPATPMAAPTWSGFYLGGTLGGAWNNNSVDVVTTTIPSSTLPL